jgi:hypothetical protein
MVEIKGMEYFVEYSYDYRMRRKYHKGIRRINSNFSKLMELVGQAIESGKRVDFIYQDNLIDLVVSD